MKFNICFVQCRSSWKVHNVQRSYICWTSTYFIFTFTVTGFVPGPILYGALIDSTCLLWKTSCGSTGACVLYNNVAFRWRLHGITASLKIVAGCFYCICMLLLWKHKRYRDPPDLRIQTYERKYLESETNTVMTSLSTSLSTLHISAKETVI